MKISLYLSALFSVSLALVGCQTQQSSTSAAMPTAQPAIARPTIPDHTVSILDFGAAGDGTTDNTAAFAKAIDTCAAAGGGHVVVPAGTYFTGPIHLKSQIDFHLDAGSKILFSRKFDDFPL